MNKFIIEFLEVLHRRYERKLKDLEYLKSLTNKCEQELKEIESVVNSIEKIINKAIDDAT